MSAQIPSRSYLSSEEIAEFPLSSPAPIRHFSRAPAPHAIAHSMDPLDHFRSAWTLLRERVERALRTQVGDATRLGETADMALSYLHAAQSVREYICPLLNACLRACL